MTAALDARTSRHIAFQQNLSAREALLAMDRTAEEFVHQLPSGRWFVGDFVRTDARGDDIFLVEIPEGLDGVELPLSAIANEREALRTYSRKSRAKRAAQRLIESLLDEDRRW
jgi:hypothetical protein